MLTKIKAGPNRGAKVLGKLDAKVLGKLEAKALEKAERQEEQEVTEWHSTLEELEEHAKRAEWAEVQRLLQRQGADQGRVRGAAARGTVLEPED